MLPAFLQTSRRESFKTWRFRTLMNWYPMYFGTGGKILFWSGDSREVHLRLRRSIWTYNYVGTIFGGSLFAASDPFYMLMLLQILGKQYVVWDKPGRNRFRKPGRNRFRKPGRNRFRKPGRNTLYMRYELTDELLDSIQQDVTANGQTERMFTLQWKDADGIVHAEIERLCYIADKKFYELKKGDRQQSRFRTERSGKS